MVTKEDFDKEQLEWLRKQFELRRHLQPFMAVKLYSGLDKWLTDEEHVCAFVNEYLGSVIQEMRDNLSKENFEKVRCYIKESQTFDDNLC